MTPPGASAALILNVGRDQSVLQTRALVLRSVGYTVESASSVEEAICHFRKQDFDLVLLCHSFPPPERQRLIRLVRNDRSTTPVVFISSSSASADRFADVTIDNRPASLLSALHKLLLSQRTE